MSETITYLRGDATAPQAKGVKVIAHVCNDLGGWGKGFVVALSRRWPEPEAAYRRWHRERAGNDFELGAVQLVWGLSHHSRRIRPGRSVRALGVRAGRPCSGATWAFRPCGESTCRAGRTRRE